MTQLHLLHQPRAVPWPPCAGTLRLLALFGLLLLPIQMRAGTDYVHPHALLHLLLDASDHVIDHHLDSAAPGHQHGAQGSHARGTQAASPDLPTFESIQMAAGGLTVSLATLVVLLVIPGQERVWPRSERWRGRRVRPEPPPPRRRAPAKSDRFHDSSFATA